MRASFTLLAAAAIAATVAAQQPETPLPCYQEKCSALVESVSSCGVTVNAAGEISFPVTDNTAITDKCLCTQAIVDNF
ncbi:hypothetical protein BG004_001071, partial [Podila humilis]